MTGLTVLPSISIIDIVPSFITTPSIENGEVEKVNYLDIGIGMGIVIAGIAVLLVGAMFAMTGFLRRGSAAAIGDRWENFPFPVSLLQ